MSTRLKNLCRHNGGKSRADRGARRALRIIAKQERGR